MIVFKDKLPYNPKIQKYIILIDTFKNEQISLIYLHRRLLIDNKFWMFKSLGNL